MRRFLLAVWILFTIFNSFLRASANASHQFYAWDEVRTGSFVIIYPLIEGTTKETILALYGSQLPPDQQDFGHLILYAYGETLEEEYQRSRILLNVNLELPISVRVYPRESDYYNLNAYAALMPPGATHGHVGEKEISLIAENIAKDPLVWQMKALNAFRSELSAIAVEKLTKGKAPPGLIVAVSQYLLDPREVLSAAISMAKQSSPDLSLGFEQLWSDEQVLHDAIKTVQAVSTIAFLVDSYGWTQFLDFMNALTNATNLASAYETVYKSSLDSAEKLWRSYYPVYLEERWQYHFLYNVDLESYHRMIQMGAYNDALALLTAQIDLLEQVGEIKSLLALQDLFEKAKTGEQGLSFVQQARQNCAEGDYSLCLDKLAKARSIFEIIGDEQRLVEIGNLEKVARDVQSLRQDFEQKKWVALITNSSQSVEELLQISRKLIKMGDRQSEKNIAKIIQAIKARNMLLLTLSLIVFFVMLLRRIKSLRKRVHLETYL